MSKPHQIWEVCIPEWYGRDEWHASDEQFADDAAEAAVEDSDDEHSVLNNPLEVLVRMIGQTVVTHFIVSAEASINYSAAEVEQDTSKETT